MKVKREEINKTKNNITIYKLVNVDYIKSNKKNITLKIYINNINITLIITGS